MLFLRIRQAPAREEHQVLGGMKVAGLALSSETFGIPAPEFLLNALNLFLRHAEARQRLAPHQHRRLENFSECAGKIDTIESDQLAPVKHPDEHGA